MSRPLFRLESLPPQDKVRGRHPKPRECGQSNFQEGPCHRIAIGLVPVSVANLLGLRSRVVCARHHMLVEMDLREEHDRYA